MYYITEFLFFSFSKEETTLPLASALDILDENKSNISFSVFSNPYREAENYEQSLLERHVKMTTIQETEPSKPKKICFKYNKGKCRLGDKCQFLHHNPNSSHNSERNNSDSEDQSTETKKTSKKRCGLKDDLVPPKKYMKTFYHKK